MFVHKGHPLGFGFEEDLRSLLNGIHLADAMHARYNTAWNPEDLKEAIHLYRRAIDSLASSIQTSSQSLGDKPINGLFREPIASRQLSSCLGLQTSAHPTAGGMLRHCRLGLLAALAHLFAYVCDIGHINEQIRLSKEGLSESSLHPCSVAYLHRLGVAFRRRYELTGSLPDLDEAIVVLHRAACAHQEDYVPLGIVLGDYACSLIRRHEHLGNRTDLTEGLALHRKALAQHTGNHPEHYVKLLHFAHALIVSFATSGDPQNLRDAGSVCKEVLQLSPPGHRDRPGASGALATALWMCYEQTNALEDLQSAIHHMSETMDLTRDLPRYGNNLGAMLQRRFCRQGDIGDLERAITLFRDTLAIAPASWRFRDYVIGNLATSLGDLFFLQGDFATLEEAIRLQRQALQRYTPGDFQKSIALNNLARLVLAQFQETRDADDLSEAIDLRREALSLSPADRLAPQHGDAVNQLAEVLVVSFESLGNLDHLHEAIGLHRRWLEEGNPGHHRQGHFLYCAANTFFIRFAHSQQETDLDNAIQQYNASLVLCPVGHPERHKIVHALTSALRTRCQSSPNPVPNDIADAIAMQKDAIQLLPLAHPDRALVLCGLARMYLTKGYAAFSISDAMYVVSEALRNEHCSAHVRFRESDDVLQILHEQVEEYKPRSDSLCRRLLDVHTLAIRLLPSIANFGLDIRARLRLLMKAERIAARAARIALALNELSAAIEILEEGRAVFWAQCLRLRSTFDTIPQHIAKELTLLANRLEAKSDGRSPTPSSDVKEKVALEELASQRRMLSERFETLVRQVRAIDGFGRFLLPASFTTLAQAAQAGIVVTLIPGRTESHALIMRNVGAKAVLEFLVLPITDERFLTLSHALQHANHSERQRLRSKCRRIQVNRSLAKLVGSGQVLAELWHTVAFPIIKQLQLQWGSRTQRPRLWWCATGVSAFLPIHAAGTFSGEASCCSDYVLSSFTPTIGALMSARERHTTVNRASARILLAGVPHPFQGDALENVASEMQKIKSTVPSQNVMPLPAEADCSVNSRASATVEDVVSRLPDASLLHLACHGTQDRHNALDSGFLMRDRMMTVAHLMSLKLPNAFFAFLSACETAKGDLKQPDQAVHLAAAILFVGFRSVIGTMWTMGDVDGPIVARLVYEHLFNSGTGVIHPDTIPYALDEAMLKLRAMGLHPSRWAPYVHFGI